jgi:PAS domain S-box-containing protein
MNDPSFLGLVQNISLLLALVLVFDMLVVQNRTRPFKFRQAVTGILLGGIGVVVMMTPWVLTPGVIFDTRSVLLGISGIFFGSIPTVIAMVMTAGFRIYQGGTGALTGVLVILATGTLGIVWRHSRNPRLEKIDWRELYLFGILSHIVMLLLMLTFPWEVAKRVLSNITLPVLVIYPLGTVLLGMLMSNRLRREQTQEVLTQTTMRLNATQKLAKMGGWEWDVVRQYMFWTDEVYRLHGLSPASVPAGSPEHIQKSLNCYDPADRSVVLAAFQDCIEKGLPYDLEFPFTNLQGEQLWVRTQAEAVRENGRTVRVLGSMMDITERKKADAALRESEERFKSLHNASFGGIAIHDKGIILECNQGLSEMMGYSLDELLGDMDGLLLVAPESRDLVRNNIITGYEKPYEAFGLRKNGEIFPMRLEGRNVPYKGKNVRTVEFRDITETRRAEEKAQADQVQLQLLLAETERSRQALLSVVEDQRETEEQVWKLNAELEQRVAERTAQLTAVNLELEAFSYSVSHDLRAPLRTLDGFSAALISDYQEKLDEQAQHYLTRIQEASRRMGQLIDDLLNLSRITRRGINPERVDLSLLVRQVADDLQAQLPGQKAEIRVCAGMVVRADPGLMKIAVENLLQNALKYSSKQEVSHIEVGALEQRDADGTVFFVRDNGAGFDMAYANKLFSPFQRLHGMNEYAGTGIGLTIVQRIISRHGGRIWPEAAVNQGATFYFTLKDE